jgi:hypothetical protein
MTPQLFWAFYVVRVIFGVYALFLYQQIHYSINFVVEMLATVEIERETL